MKCLKINVLAVLLGCSSLIMADSITYFGLPSSLPIDITADTKVCILNNPANQLAMINTDLKNRQPIYPEQIASLYAEQFQQLSDTVVCQFKASQLGVTALPAVVVNNHYVVYGQLSITSAVEEIHSYLEAQHVP